MRQLFLCVALSSIIFSCSKSDDDEIINPTPEDNFYALTVGNSWVYKNYKYNSESSDYEDIGVIDSVSIVGLQEFNGQTYYKFRRWTTGNENYSYYCNENGEHFEYLKESNGDLINEEGSIKFTNTNFEERLLREEVWGKVYGKRVNEETDVETEAGVFNCNKSERYARNKNGEKMQGLDNVYYSEGIGLVYNTVSGATSESPIIIRRLNSYNIL